MVVDRLGNTLAMAAVRSPIDMTGSVVVGEFDVEAVGVLGAPFGPLAILSEGPEASSPPVKEPTKAPNEDVTAPAKVPLSLRLTFALALFAIFFGAPLAALPAFVAPFFAAAPDGFGLGAADAPHLDFPLA